MTTSAVQTAEARLSLSHSTATHLSTTPKHHSQGLRDEHGWCAYLTPMGYCSRPDEDNNTCLARAGVAIPALKTSHAQPSPALAQRIRNMRELETIDYTARLRLVLERIIVAVSHLRVRTFWDGSKGRASNVCSLRSRSGLGENSGRDCVEIANPRGIETYTHSPPRRQPTGQENPTSW